MKQFAVVVAAVVLSVMSCNAASAASTSTPPVIKEPFTVLPCDEATTIGMEGCGEHRLLAADSRINGEVSVLYSFLGGATSKRHLAEAQSAWLAYRHADCLSQSDAFQGGSEAAVEFELCEAADDSARSTDLAAFYRELTQGHVRVPAFP